MIDIYEWIGFVIFWLSATWGVLYVIVKILEKWIEQSGNIKVFFEFVNWRVRKIREKKKDSDIPG